MLFGTLGPFLLLLLFHSEMNSLVDSQDVHLTVILKAVNILLDPSTLTENDPQWKSAHKSAGICCCLYIRTWYLWQDIKWTGSYVALKALCSTSKCFLSHTHTHSLMNASRESILPEENLAHRPEQPRIEPPTFMNNRWPALPPAILLKCSTRVAQWWSG